MVLKIGPHNLNNPLNLSECGSDNKRKLSFYTRKITTMTFYNGKNTIVYTIDPCTLGARFSREVSFSLGHPVF